MVDVVGKPHAHASCRGAPDRVAHDLRRLGPEVEVVLRQVERALRAVEERGDGVGDLRRRLATVDQSTDFDAWVHGQARRRPDRRDAQLLPARRAGAAPARAARALPRRAGGRVDSPRRRGAGLPRDAHLGHPAHVGATADGRRAGRGDGDDRPPRPRRARPRRRRPALERRADAPGRRALEPPADEGGGRGRPRLRARARPRAHRRAGRPARARGARRPVCPPSVARRRGRVQAGPARRLLPSALGERPVRCFLV